MRKRTVEEYGFLHDQFTVYVTKWSNELAEKHNVVTTKNMSIIDVFRHSGYTFNIIQPEDIFSGEFTISLEGNGRTVATTKFRYEDMRA